MVILSAILLISENKKLCIENQRQKKKRVEKRTYIARGGVLSGAERASRVQAAQEGVVEGAAEAATERPQRAPRKCSMCYSIKHNIRTCPRRQATSQQINTPNITICGCVIRNICPWWFGLVGWGGPHAYMGHMLTDYVNVFYKRVAYIRESRTIKPHQNRDFLTLVKSANS